MKMGEVPSFNMTLLGKLFFLIQVLSIGFHLNCKIPKSLKKAEGKYPYKSMDKRKYPSK